MIIIIITILWTCITSNDKSKVGNVEVFTD